MLRRTVVVFLTIFLFQADMFSQKYFFRSYSVEQGLPQSSLYSIMQDSRGFIWMGADGAGVSRFDGKTFQTFSKADGLSDNVVRDLFEDSKGNIWIGTNNGITLYDGYGFRKIGKEQGLDGAAVLRIIEASDGIIWAATNDGGLSRINPRDSLSVISFTAEDGLTSDFIFDIYEDQGKMIWLGMVGGVNIIEFEDSTSQKIKKIYKPSIESESVVSILSIEGSPDGNILFGSYGNGLFEASSIAEKEDLVIKPSPVNDMIPGMLVWDILKNNDEIWLATDKNGVVRLLNGKIKNSFNKESGLQSNQILDILKDNEGNIWFASFGQGALMFKDEKFISYDENNGVKGTVVLDIMFDSGNIFYVATDEGLLKFKKNGEEIERLKYFSVSDGLNAQGATAIEKTSDGQLYIGTQNGLNILRGSKLSSFAGNRSLGNQNINTIVTGFNKDLWIGTAGGYGRVFGDNLFFMNQGEGLINDEIQIIIEDRRKRIWLGTLGGLVMLDNTNYADFDTEEGLTTLKINTLAEDPYGDILIGTADGGIFKFDAEKDSMPVSAFANKSVLSSNTINTLKFVNDSLLIAGNDKGFDLLVLDKDQNIRIVFHNTLSDGFSGGENTPNSISVDNDGMIWLGTKKGLVRYNPSFDLNYDRLPEPYITGVKLFYKEVDWVKRNFVVNRFSGLPEDLVLSHNDNHLTFTFTALSYENPDDLEFSYFLENHSIEWSPFSRNREKEYSGLTPGSYVLKVKARNKYGLTGIPAEYKFVVKPPFWQTPWFLAPATALFIIIFLVIMKIRERSLVAEKIKLEIIVEERTREVVEQKDQIEKQRDVVTHQKKEITDSIQYAERIQRAVLPMESILKNNFDDYFILFRPKDIVSGDFYWMAEKDDHVIFTAADCTGHGVPGAFMSMLGVSFLNKIVNEEGVVKPSQILNSLRDDIIVSLKQEGTYETNKDGMDIAICSLDRVKKTLHFAGANNPLLLVRKENGEYIVTQTKADKMPVGIHSRMDDFTNHEIELKKGDTIYLFSDGFEDQFGGPDGRKFMKTRFNKMLTDNQHLPMADQREIFSRTLDEWMCQQSANWTPTGQIDDVILIGVRF